MVVRQSVVEWSQSVRVLLLQLLLLHLESDLHSMWWSGHTDALSGLVDTQDDDRLSGRLYGTLRTQEPTPIGSETSLGPSMDPTGPLR